MVVIVGQEGGLSAIHCCSFCPVIEWTMWCGRTGEGDGDGGGNGIDCRTYVGGAL